MKNFFLIYITFCFSSLSYAEEKSSGFLQMQNVLGKWEGTLIRSAQEDIPISLEYKLISDGSAIVEHGNEDGIEMMTAFADHFEGEISTYFKCVPISYMPQILQMLGTDQHTSLHSQ